MNFPTRCNIHSHFLIVNGEQQPCPYLPLGSTPSDKNIFGQTYESRERQFQQMSKRILKECSDRIDSIEVMYQCDFEKLLKRQGNDIYKFFNSSDQAMTTKRRPPPPLAPRSGLRGGCVEVMGMVGEADERYDIHYWDINR